MNCKPNIVFHAHLAEIPHPFEDCFLPGGATSCCYVSPPTLSVQDGDCDCIYMLEDSRSCTRSCRSLRRIGIGYIRTAGTLRYDFASGRTTARKLSTPPSLVVLLLAADNSRNKILGCCSFHPVIRVSQATSHPGSHASCF